MVSINFIILIWLIHFALSQDPACNDNQQRRIDIIENRINEAHEIGKMFGRCAFFGYKDDSPGGVPTHHRLIHHRVCYDGVSFEKKMFVAAITPTDLNGEKGTSVSPNVANAMKALYHKCGCDECGHIVPKSFGGHGYEANIFPQNGNLNRGLYNQVCNEISDFLSTAPAEPLNHRWAMMRVAFIYEDRAHPRRPSLFYYSFLLYEDGLKFQITGLFENENHYDLKLKNCWDTRVLIEGGRRKYNFVENPEDDYYSRRSCKPQERSAFERYGPSFPF